MIHSQRLFNWSVFDLCFLPWFLLRTMCNKAVYAAQLIKIKHSIHTHNFIVSTSSSSNSICCTFISEKSRYAEGRSHSIPSVTSVLQCTLKGKHWNLQHKKSILSHFWTCKSCIRSFVFVLWRYLLTLIAVAGDLDFSEDNTACLAANRIYKIVQQVWRIAWARYGKD